MKKHQLAAMVLSVFSAGILISCTKPNEANDDAKKSDSELEQKASAQSQTDIFGKQNKATNTEGTMTLSETEVSDYLKDVADVQIVPAYQDVAEQSNLLNELAVNHCSSGNVGVANLAILRKQWLMLARAWAKAEKVNFGPAMDSMSNLYINYYPDERGLVHKGVTDLIKSNPELTPEQLAQESAVVQGIPGLEDVLFTNDTLDAGQCQYVISTSEALAQRLNQIKQAWESAAIKLLAGENVDIKLGMNRWINSLLSLVETTKSNSLDKPLGLTGSKKGHLPASTARQSREIIASKVEALNIALTDPALVKMLNEKDKGTLTDKISTILADTSSLLAQLPDDIAEASPEQQQVLYEKLTELTQVIKRQLMPTLSVQVGFNSTDGD